MFTVTGVGKLRAEGGVDSAGELFGVVGVFAAFLMRGASQRAEMACGLRRSDFTWSRRSARAASSWSSASNAMSAGSSPAGFGLHDGISVLVDADPVHGGDARVGGGEGARGRVIGLGYGFFAPREFQFGVAVVTAGAGLSGDVAAEAESAQDQLRGWGAPCGTVLGYSGIQSVWVPSNWTVVSTDRPLARGQPLQPRGAIRHE